MNLYVLQGLQLIYILHTLTLRVFLDMGYWPGPKALGVEETATCTFSLAVDDSTKENGCLRYVPGSGLARKLRQHAPLSGSRDEGHALTIDVDESKGCREGDWLHS